MKKTALTRLARAADVAFERDATELAANLRQQEALEGQIEVLRSRARPALSTDVGAPVALQGRVAEGWAVYQKREIARLLARQAELRAEEAMLRPRVARSFGRTVALRRIGEGMK